MGTSGQMALDAIAHFGLNLARFALQPRADLLAEPLPCLIILGYGTKRRPEGAATREPGRQLDTMDAKLIVEGKDGCEEVL